VKANEAIVETVTVPDGITPTTRVFILVPETMLVKAASAGV
jgi:hypothetical protein